MLNCFHLNRLASLPQGMKRIFGGYFILWQRFNTQNLNYYRFTGYALPFLISVPDSQGMARHPSR
jgi:hypothetical protein